MVGLLSHPSVLRTGLSNEGFNSLGRNLSLLKATLLGTGVRGGRHKSLLWTRNSVRTNPHAPQTPSLVGAVVQLPAQPSWTLISDVLQPEVSVSLTLGAAREHHARGACQAGKRNACPESPSRGGLGHQGQARSFTSILLLLRPPELGTDTPEPATPRP